MTGVKAITVEPALRVSVDSSEPGLNSMITLPIEPEGDAGR